jgi:hypothetical protein
VISVLAALIIFLAAGVFPLAPVSGEVPSPLITTVPVSIPDPPPRRGSLGQAYALFQPGPREALRHRGSRPALYRRSRVASVGGWGWTSRAAGHAPRPAGGAELGRSVIA